MFIGIQMFLIVLMLLLNVLLVRTSYQDCKLFKIYLKEFNQSNNNICKFVWMINDITDIVLIQMSFAPTVSSGSSSILHSHPQPQDPKQSRACSICNHFWGRRTSGTALLPLSFNLALRTDFCLQITSLSTSSMRVPRRKEHSSSFLHEGYI